MKKILFFISNFLPGYRAGGPVTSIANLSKLLDKDFEIIIVTSNKDLGVDKQYDNVKYDQKVKYEDFNVIYLSKINSSTVLKTIKDIKPDLVYLNSFFSTLTQLVLFKSIKHRFKIPIILAPRGELQENALAIKKTKKKIYLTLYKLMKVNKRVYFHATDKIEYNRIKKMFLMDNISTIPNVPKISDEQPLSKTLNELNLVFISRIRDNKNLLFALQALRACEGNIKFDIYGPIEDEIYWKKCQFAMETLPQHISSEYKGVVKPMEITNIMRKYHALLLPTKTENFGHVIVEAMQSGIIPIISNQTPWVDLQKNKAGWDLNLENIDEFTKVLNILYEMNSEKYSDLSKNTMEYINERLNVDQLKEKYIHFFNQVIANYTKGK